MHNIKSIALLLVTLTSINSWGQSAINQTFEWVHQVGLAAPSDDLPSGFEYREIRRMETPGGTHIHFNLQYQGLDILGADAMLWIRPNGRPLAQITPDIIGSWTSTMGEGNLWFPTPTGLIAVTIIDHDYGPQPLRERIFISQNQDTLFRVDLVKHLADTTAHGFIFNPDPLTKAGVTYGGSYVDGGDMNLSILDPLRDSASFQATYVPGQGFTLASPQVTIKELDAPVMSVPTSTDGNFYASRDQTMFEMVNVMHHIQKQKAHVDSLGYGQYVTYSIEVDVNAWNGADNSAFLPYMTPP